MMPQREASEPLDEQASSSYRGYEGHPDHDERHDEAFYAQAWGGEPAGNMKPPMINADQPAPLLHGMVYTIVYIVAHLFDKVNVNL